MDVYSLSFPAFYTVAVLFLVPFKDCLSVGATYPVESTSEFHVSPSVVEASLLNDVLSISPVIFSVFGQIVVSVCTAIPA
jgi:hypothetical protein